MDNVTVSDAAVCREAVFWSAIARFQLGRFHDALGDLHGATEDARSYAEWEESGRALEWQSVVDELGQPGLFGQWWVMTAEYHFALLALAHVVKSVAALPDLPQFRDSELLKLLRDYREHWEDPTGRAGRGLADLRPGHDEEPFVFTKKWVMLHGLQDDDIFQWLRDVDEAARRWLTEHGEDHPDWHDPLWPSSRDAKWPFVRRQPPEAQA